MCESAEDFSGSPDQLERLWTPHRMVYINREDRDPDTATCPFCSSPKKSDPAGLIVHRGETCFVVMNLYPYSPGHLLVCPYRHVADYTDLTADETVELASLTQTAMAVLRHVSKPRGFNIGMNQGQVAGAGIAAHLHQHVVPRWLGDSNFLPIIGQTKAVPELLCDTHKLLCAAWPSQLR